MTEVGPAYLPISLSKIKWFGVALQRFGGNGRRISSHSLALYRSSEGGPLKKLELGIDGKIYSEDVPSEHVNFAWAIPHLDESQLRNLAWFCDAAATRGDDLGYWLEHDEKHVLVDDGQIITGSSGSLGFTCSTFVLSLFTAQVITLLNLASWQERGETRVREDNDVQSYLIHFLESRLPSQITPEIKTRIPLAPFLRYSPEDVIGACRIFQPGDEFQPIEFEVADSAGRDVRCWLDHALQLN